MDTKRCSKCGEEKPIDNFTKRTCEKDGYNRLCRVCYKIRKNKNIEKVKSSNPELYSQRKELHKQNMKRYREENGDKLKLSCKEWYLKNKEKQLNKARERRLKNPNANKDWIEKNRERYNELQRKRTKKEKYKEWYSRNKEKRSKVHSYRKENDQLYSLKKNIKSCIFISIKKHGYSKKSKTQQLLCCSYDCLTFHLGPKPEGNYHLDHICPCAQAQNEEELIKLQHYTNFRWMQATDNISKSDNWTQEGEEMCRKLLGRDWMY